MKWLAQYLLKLPTEEVVVDGTKITPRTFRNFFVEKNGKKKLVKVLSVETMKKAFLQFQPITGIDLHTSGHVFEFGGKIFEVTDIDSHLKPADIKCFSKLMSLYHESDKIHMIHQNFLDVHFYISQVSHILAPVYGESLGDICHKVLRNQSYDLSKCKKGFFHGDMHFGNILQGRNRLHIIDLNESCVSYVALNIAQCFLIEGIQNYRAEKITYEDLSNLRKQILSQLSESDRHYFDFFVSLMAYYWYIRAIPNVVSPTDDKKEHFVKHLQNALNFLRELQNGEGFYPVLGSNSLGDDGKIDLSYVTKVF